MDAKMLLLNMELSNHAQEVAQEVCKLIGAPYTNGVLFTEDLKMLEFVR